MKSHFFIYKDKHFIIIEANEKFLNEGIVTYEKKHLNKKIKKLQSMRDCGFTNHLDLMWYLSNLKKFSVCNVPDYIKTAPNWNLLQKLPYYERSEITNSLLKERSYRIMDYILQLLDGLLLFLITWNEYPLKDKRIEINDYLFYFGILKQEVLDFKNEVIGDSLILRLLIFGTNHWHYKTYNVNIPVSRNDETKEFHTFAVELCNLFQKSKPDPEIYLHLNTFVFTLIKKNVMENIFVKNEKQKTKKDNCNLM
jgi:hypothetical protein